MFLHCQSRKKHLKLHPYWSVVESRCGSGGDTLQRQVLYVTMLREKPIKIGAKTVCHSK